MLFWRELKAFCSLFSEEWFRDTVMSTIEPEEMSAGRRMEGNSICDCSVVSLCNCAGGNSWLGWTHYSFVLGEEDGHAGIDLADGEGDEHCDYCGCVVVVEDSWCCCQTSVREPRRKWTGVR